MTQPVYEIEETERPENSGALTKAIIGLAVAVVALMLGVVVRIPGLFSSGGPAEGDVLVPFQGESVFGEKVDLADFEGQVVVIDFWATWCPPCVKKMPDLIKIQSEFADRGVQVIGVSGDVDPEAVRNFENRFNTNFPTIFTGAAGITEQYQISGYPTVIIADRTGKITFRSYFGDIRAEILKVL